MVHCAAASRLRFRRTKYEGTLTLSPVSSRLRPSRDGKGFARSSGMSARLLRMGFSADIRKSLIIQK